MIHNKLKKLSKFIVKLTMDVNTADDNAIMKRYVRAYGTLSVFLQLSILIVVATLFGNLMYFVIMFFIYLLVRNTGSALHFDSFDRCFWWTNLTFITTITMLHGLIDVLHADIWLVVLFYGVLNGLSLSCSNGDFIRKFMNAFAYEINERTELKRNLDGYIVDNIESEEILKAIKCAEDINPNATEVAYSYYKYGQTAEQIATDTHQNKTSVRRKINAVRTAVHTMLTKIELP